MAKRRRDDEDDDDDLLEENESERPAKKVKGIDPGVEYTIITACFLVTLVGMLLVMLL
jgi:hypothetical protein